MLVTEQHRQWLARLALVPLKPRAYALAVTLASLKPDMQAWSVHPYEELMAVLGSRTGSVSIARGHNIVWRAAQELEQVGLIERQRQTNRHGNAFGPETPYVWRCVIGEPLQLPAWADAAASTMAFALGFGVMLGPTAIALRAQLDAAGDTDGNLAITVAELVSISGLSDKTAEKHLLAQARHAAGMKARMIGPRRPRKYAIELAVPRLPARPGRPAGPLRLPLGINVARLSGMTPIAARSGCRHFDQAELAELLDGLPGAELLEDTISNCEAHRGADYTATEKVVKFVEPLLQLSQGPIGVHWPDFITDKLLPAMADKSERELILHPRRYVATVCRNECEIDSGIDIFAPVSATTTEHPDRAEAIDIRGEDCEDEDWEPAEGPSPFDDDWPEEEMPPFS